MKRKIEKKHLFLWFVPGKDKPREFRVSKSAFRVIVGLLIILGLVLTVEFALYSVLLRHSFQRKHLIAENNRLRQDVARVEILEQKLRELQQFGRKVQRSLTEGADLERIIETSEKISENSFPRVKPIDDNWFPNSSLQLLNHFSPGKSLSPPQFDGSLIRYPIYWPVDGFITRGYEVSPIDPSRGHAGLDLAVPRGTPVRAVADGVVLISDWTPRLGHRVVIDHGDEFFTIYGHNEMVLVYPHQWVKAGTPVALAGNSGISTAPHLHFEIWLNGNSVDPLLLLPQRGEKENEQKTG